MLRHMHEWKLALFRFSEVTVCWLCFFSPLTDSTTISLCKRVALLTGNVCFFHHALSVPNYSYNGRLPMSIFIILFFFFSCAVAGIRQWRQWQSHSLQPQFFSPWQHVEWLQQVLKGKLRIQLWHVFLFLPWVRRTTLKSVYITTVFFFLKRYFLGFLLCIKTITPDQRHFVLVTFLLVSIFLCLI